MLLGKFNKKKMAINVVFFVIASIVFVWFSYLQLISSNSIDRLKATSLSVIVAPIWVYGLVTEIIGPIRRSISMNGAFARLSAGRLEFADGTDSYPVDRNAKVSMEYYRPKGKIYHVYRLVIENGATGELVSKTSLFCLSGDKQAFVDQLRRAIRSL